MSLYNRYIFFLVVISCLVNTSLAFLGHNDLSTYLLVNTVCFLVLTLIFMPSNPKVYKTFNILSLFFFAGFLIIVIIEFTSVVTSS